ncbi:MAG: cation diffusion facilitator family transporter [Candidatus Limivicinus sp.]|nr:cation diffusion facilitator family transporter [Clostridiales bacterium]MDY3860892.1 cation diffusion facilitator family transporter [Candidatus Limivicinus sp.]
MIKLLTKLFIKDSENVTDPAVRTAYGRLCSFCGIFLNILLFAGKYFAGLISGSVAITADAFNNLSDAGSSIITLLGFAIAAKKPDAEHPFGHGRVEYLAGLALSTMIMLMGIELGRSSIEKIIHPEAIDAGILPAVILIASIAVKFYMSMYNRAVGKKINSAAMQATATDSLSDSLSTAVVLLSMLISWLFNVNIDGWAGLIVAVFVLVAGFNAAKDTFSPLLGQAPDRELVRDIERSVMAHPEILGIHDLILHDYGPGRQFVSLHAEVDGNGNIFEMHDAVDCAEMEILDRFGINATIHMDPIDAGNSRVAELRSAVAEKLKENWPDMTIHDFRMVPGNTHTNLIFDAAVPAELKSTDAELAAGIKALVSETWPGCFAVVNIDRSYV